MALGKRLRESKTREYWTGLVPDLHIEADHGWAPIEVDALATQSYLRREGYFEIPDVLPDDMRQRMLATIYTLRENDWPPTMAFVFDEFWQIPARLSEVMKTVLGEEFKQLPDFWAWFLDPNLEEPGWRPHRDKAYPTIVDGLHNSMTIWVALDEATPKNGCIYVLPAYLDSRHPNGDLKHMRLEEPQNARALAVSAGTVLGWDQNILHWGGRSSRHAKNPRVSFACEYQRGTVAPFNEPLLDPMTAPKFEQRLRLIGQQLLQYAHMHKLSPELRFVANGLLMMPR